MTEPSLNLTPPIALPVKRKIRWGIVCLGLILIVYAVFLLRRFEPAINEPDANGYWAQGTLLVNTGQSWFKPASDAQYIGMHWLLTPDGKYVSRYPPGLPLLIGAVYAVFGFKAAVLVNPALAIASLIGFYLLLRKLLPISWGLMGVLLLAFNPTFVTHALANDSHMAVTFCVVWGIYLLLSWSSLPRWWTIFLAGLVFGCIPSIRYPDAVMGAAVLVFMLLHWRRPWFPLHLTLAALGAAIPIVLLMIRNQEVLGAWWRTGYALTNEQTGFGWGYFREHWLQYIDSLNASGVGLLFGLGLAAMTSMLFVPRWRALGWMLWLMCLPMVLLYMAYYWGGGGGMTLRFLLPIIPCFIIAGLWLLNEMTKHAPRGARVAVPLVVLLIQLSWAAAESGPGMSSEQSKEVLATVTNALAEVTTPGDVIISQNQVLQHLDFVGKWKLADASLVGFGGGGPGAGPMGGPGRGGRLGGPGFGPGPGGGFGGPDGRGGRGFGPQGMGPEDAADAPSPMQMEKNLAQRELYQGFDAQQRFARDVFTWAGQRSVWLIGPEQEIEQEAQTLLPDSKVEVVKRVQLPEQQQMDEPLPGRGGRGPGGPGLGGRGRRGGPDGGPGGFAGPGRRGGRGGRAGPGGPGGGGPMGAAFMGETEVVIARWTAPAASAQ